MESRLVSVFQIKKNMDWPIDVCDSATLHQLSQNQHVQLLWSLLPVSLSLQHIS
jgi:hypothetical protein